MTDLLPNDVAKRLKRPLRLTLAGLWVERMLQAFWPFASLAALGVALVLSGVLPSLPRLAGQGLIAVPFLGALIALVWGIRRLRPPTRAEARARLDATLAGQPLATLADTQATGTNDPAARGVWRVHRARMADRLAGLRAQPPKPNLAPRDPFAFRLIALTALVAALYFGPRSTPGELVDLLPGGAPDALAEASWEGWIEPPSYTGKPTLYLADQAPGTLAVPIGSRVTLRLYGRFDSIDITESFSEAPPSAPQPTHLFKVDRDGTLRIDEAEWRFVATPDLAPQIQTDGELERTIAGELRLPFVATDDYGISAGQARIAIDLARTDRRHGLTPEPEPRESIVVDLPMPFRGDRAEIRELLVDNFSEHPWADLPVQLTFAATDAAGQTGQSAPVEITLPGRRFLDPLARAFVEQRRDLLWSIDNTPRVARILRAVSNRPEGLFAREILYLKLRTAVREIEADPTPETRDRVAQVLWDIATEIEDGNLADALERLRRAQERLSEAMRQGASPQELAELMQDYRDALSDYMRELAQNAPEGGESEQAESERMDVTPEDLQAMMDRIEELMQQGRTAEAQQLLDMLQQMMENMQVAEGGPGQQGQGEGEQAMQGLRETLREQQELSDEAFRNQPGMGPQPGQQPGQPGQPGEQGETGEQPGEGEGTGERQGEGQGREGDLAGRQRALADELGRQREDLPGGSSPEGETAGEALDRAGRAMDEAAEALEQGETSDALDRQAEAMEALREGMRNLEDALRAEAQSDQPGRQGEAGGQPGDRRAQDPLGRNPGGRGTTANDSPLEDREDIYRRAQELMQELRRRAGEPDRPDIERDYLRRLLDLF